MRTEAWSSGGGTQSAAIAALICQGVLKPDVCVIIDTEREVTATWRYHETIIVPNLKAAGYEIHRIPKSQYATVDLWGGENKHTLLIPAFTDKTKTGKMGKLPTYCSNEWKARVVRRFLNDRFPNKDGYNIWLGMSFDEVDRMKSDTGKWEYKHPLIDDGRKMTRQDCKDLVKAMGWPPPPRSRCWMCPNQSKEDWEDLEQNEPADYKKSVNFEKGIQKRDPHVYLRNEKGSEGDCMSGMCFV